MPGIQGKKKIRNERVRNVEISEEDDLARSDPNADRITQVI